jgi:hypothetical protein
MIAFAFGWKTAKAKTSSARLIRKSSLIHEVALDQVAYDMLMDGQCATATELDGGSDIDTIAADHAACPDCESAGCSTCDGTPLTEDEIAAYTALAAHERKEHR